MIPCHANGIHDVRFTGKEFQTESHRDLGVLEAFFRRQRELIGKRLRTPLIVGDMLPFLVAQGDPFSQKGLITLPSRFTDRPKNPLANQGVKRWLFPDAVIVA